MIKFFRHKMQYYGAFVTIIFYHFGPYCHHLRILVCNVRDN